jgi:hypothetical protein
MEANSRHLSLTTWKVNMIKYSLMGFYGMLLFLGASLRAQELDAAVAWSCQPDKGLVIHYYPSLADAGSEVKKLNPLVFFSLVDLDTDSVSVTGTRSRVVACSLKKDRVEVILEPGVPNANLLGRCGAAITGVVTLKRNGKSLLTEEPFENINCHERERFIRTITIRAGMAKPEIQYGSYEE